MRPKDSGKANWKDPVLLRRYIDLCLEETAAKRFCGGSLKKESWDRIRIVLKEEKICDFTQKQLKNEWDYLKRKYQVWTRLIGVTGNSHYDPQTNTINWSPEQWDDYIKKYPEAKQFRFKSLEYADDMKALFDGMGATGKDAWGPSKHVLPKNIWEPSKQGLSEDEIEICTQTHVNLEKEHMGIPSSSNTLKPEKKNENKRQKKNSSEKLDNLDNQLMAVLKTLEQSDGPSIEECNKHLEEMETLDENDPLYIAATCIFCENKAYREQWVRMSNKPEGVRKSWLAMNGKS